MVIQVALNTIHERTLFYARNTIGYSDGGQARATIERIISYARHTIGDGDGGQAWATRVFASLLLSIIYILNGRKVIAWILWRVRNGKI